MFQMSKIIKSKNEWKSKATLRATENQNYRKTIGRHQKMILALKQEIKELKDLKKKTLINSQNSSQLQRSNKQQIRILTISLILKTIVSYRSVPRILNLFNLETTFKTKWIPHFTSVINWTSRFGLGLLNQVKTINDPWVAIIDHSIDIGTKKVLVILRVKLDIFVNRQNAITLNDCQCVGLKISEVVNSETISKDLEECFKLSGTPVAIIKDNDSSLKKGVSILNEKQDTTITVIEDIGHIVANALKNQFEKQTNFKNFKKLLSDGANKLRQTDIAFLTPPKLRTKGRFQSISQLSNWADKLIPLFSTKGRSKEGSLLQRLRIIFPKFSLLKPFIKNFAKTTTVTNSIMKILKNNGLNQSSYNQSIILLKELPSNSQTKKKVTQWLNKHIEIQNQILPNTAIPISSDIIESLFGKFKHIINRSAKADMNRLALIIPTLCGNLNEELILETLNMTTHKELKKWEEENIPYTIRKKRQEFFNNDIQKAVKLDSV